MRILFVTMDEMRLEELQRAAQYLAQQGLVELPEATVLDCVWIGPERRLLPALHSFRPHAIIDLTYNLHWTSRALNALKHGGPELKHIKFYQIIDAESIRGVEEYLYTASNPLGHNDMAEQGQHSITASIWDRTH